MILAGDIGGTRSRLALFADDGKGKPIRHDVLESRAHPSLEAVLRHFFGGKIPKIKAATFGVAGPVVQQRCVATNLPW
ncbi:glucokinase, partial [Klebsiella pneumoniae]|uniref:glucokinase n=1 Tax=Klebsiella pneumoniae TaxID=573 RepID=UPI003F51AF30